MTIRTSCPACGGIAKGEEFRNAAGFVWARCGTCGLLYHEEIEPYRYLNDLRESGGVLATSDFNPEESKIKRIATGEYGTCPAEQWRVRLHQAQAHVRKYGTLVEVGFGGGEILGFAKEEGHWQNIHGIEVYADYVNFGRSRGHSTFYRDLATMSPPDEMVGRADLVLVNEVMEHVDMPMEFLVNAGTMLAPDGVLWASFACMDLVPEPDTDEWHWWTEEAVKAISARAGLKVIEIEASPFAFLASLERGGR